MGEPLSSPTGHSTIRVIVMRHSERQDLGRYESVWRASRPARPWDPSITKEGHILAETVAKDILGTYKIKQVSHNDNQIEASPILHPRCMCWGM